MSDKRYIPIKWDSSTGITAVGMPSMAIFTAQDFRRYTSLDLPELCDKGPFVLKKYKDSHNQEACVLYNFSSVEPGPSEVYTIVDKNDDGLLAIRPDGKTSTIPYTELNKLISENRVNNLEFVYPDRTITYNGKVMLGISIPRHTSIKSEEDVSIKESNRSIQSEGTSPEELQGFFGVNPSDFGTIGFNFLQYFYSMMLHTCRVGDILSIPKEMLVELKCEFLKTINSTGKYKVSIFKATLGVGYSIFGILKISEDDQYASVQIMNKPNDTNSVPVQSIETEYLKWKQSRKFVG